MVVQYANERAELAHQLDEVDGLTVVSYGQTDADHPNEAVEIIIAALPAALEVLGALLTGWLAATRWARDKKGAPPSVAGIKLTRPDGTHIEVTLDDGLRPRAREALIREALGLADQRSARR
jgi:hypothetical protein